MTVGMCVVLVTGTRSRSFHYALKILADEKTMQCDKRSAARDELPRGFTPATTMVL
jgi:hypothetical protein